MSFREYQVAVDGLTNARKRQLDDMLFLAHQTASFNVFAFHQPKKLPKLETVLKPEQKLRRGQTPDEQIAVFKSILGARKQN